jgi:hypothetical protein
MTEPVSRPRDPMALHSALHSIAQSLNAAEGGHPDTARMYHFAAAQAAADAYDPGTLEAAALALILASARAEAEALTAPDPAALP